MKITVLNACENVKNYIEQVENGISAEAAWEKEAIEPFWDRLCCYSPTDLSERKPKPIRDLQGLKEQCERLSELNLALLETEFQRISSTLPNYDDSPLLVVIFPCDTNNTTVNEKQNGVVGTSLFGNILIQVNSLIEGYEAWIKYVFAHEYHHTIWGNYWFVLHAGTLSDEFINSLVIDGEADCFALELYPDLKPKWIFDMPIAEVQRLWEKTIRKSQQKAMWRMKHTCLAMKKQVYPGVPDTPSVFIWSITIWQHVRSQSLRSWR